MKKLLLTLLFTLMLLVSCGTKNNDINESSEVESVSNVETEENPLICITLSNNKTIRCELYPNIAPISVANFLSLVDSGFYTNSIFHRIIKDFMIQGGGFFYEDEAYYTKNAQTIKGEFSANGVENNLLHTPGVLSMARATDMDSASSQFFICVETSTHLDGNYAAFGKTLDEESLQVAIDLSLSETRTVIYGYSYMYNFPVEPVRIIDISRIIK